MPLNVLLLPLLGGYIFISNFRGTSFAASRYSTQPLLFASAIAGVVLLLFARFAILVLRAVNTGTLPIVWFLPVIYGFILLLGFTLVAQKYENSTLLKSIMEGGPSQMNRVVISVFTAIKENFRTQAKTNESLIGRQTIAAIGRFTKNLGLPIVYATVLFGLTGATFLYFNDLSLGNIAFWFTQAWGLPIFFTLVVCCFAIAAFTRLRLHAVTLKLGAWLLAISIISVPILTNGTEIIALFHELSPFPHSGTAAAALIFGFSYIPLNSVYPREIAVERLVANNVHDGLEQFFYGATANISDAEAGKAPNIKDVELTLKNGKVYVGLIDWTPPNAMAADAYVKILPYVSGYRDSNTKELKFTTFYTPIYRDIFKPNGEASGKGPTGRRWSDFIKIIPVKEIYSAGYFDLELYAKFLDSDSNVATPTDRFRRKAKPLKAIKLSGRVTPSH